MVVIIVIIGNNSNSSNSSSKYLDHDILYLLIALLEVAPVRLFRGTLSRVLRRYTM